MNLFYIQESQKKKIVSQRLVIIFGLDSITSWGYNINFKDLASAIQFSKLLSVYVKHLSGYVTSPALNKTG